MLAENGSLNKKRLIGHIAEILESILGPFRTKTVSILETLGMINRADSNNPEDQGLDFLPIFFLISLKKNCFSTILNHQLISVVNLYLGSTFILPGFVNNLLASLGEGQQALLFSGKTASWFLISYN